MGDYGWPDSLDKPVSVKDCQGYDLRLVWGEWDDHGVRATCTRCSFVTTPYLSQAEAEERGVLLHEELRGR